MTTPRSERAAAAVELVLLTPVFVALLCLTVLFGRVQAARGDVALAARSAARAASIERDATTARRSAQNAAMSEMSQHGYRCGHSAIDVDTSAFTSGGAVSVTVTCTVGLGDLTRLGLPGTHTVTARFSEPIDRYRGTR